jgi:hypothetical protein
MTVASTGGGSCQVPVIERKIFPDLGSAEGYCICLDAKGKHSLFVYTVARTLPFGVPSVALVNTDKGAT